MEEQTKTRTTTTKKKKKEEQEEQEQEQQKEEEEARRRRRTTTSTTTTTRLTKSRLQNQLPVSLPVKKTCNTINSNSGRTPFLTKVKLTVQIAKETVTCNNRAETSVLSECWWKRGHVTIDGHKPLSSHWVSGASNLMNINEL